MSESAYITISGRGESVYEEKKSVFYGFAEPVSREEDALALLAEAKAKYPDARHHVYAYLLRDRGLMRYSDDHEPQGTAGMPTLDAIRKPGLVDVAVVVVRYFGGTLLGTGGLVRAYGRAAADAIADGGIVTMREFQSFRLSLSYTEYPKMQALLPKLGVGVVDTVFTDRVEIHCTAPREETDRISSAVIEATAGRAAITLGDIRFDFDRAEKR